MNYTNALISLAIGIILLTLLATVGAIASRKLGFKYAYLIIPSLAIYIYISYLNSGEYGLYTVLLVNALLGFYDGTVGFRLCVKLKANAALDNKKIEQSKDITPFVMIILASILAMIGYAIEAV